jgi:anti-sigma regulatory factor (Ser/Thr protein kinase)
MMTNPPQHGPWSLTLHDRPTMAAVRRWARDHLRSLLDAPTLSDAVLVVVELVTNSYVHTTCPVRLTVDLQLGAVRIEVTDDSPVAPHIRHAARLGGRGLPMVDKMSAAWGVRPNARGKTVWSRFALAA